MPPMGDKKGSATPSRSHSGAIPRNALGPKLCLNVSSMKSNEWASGNSRTPTPLMAILATLVRKITSIGT